MILLKPLLCVCVCLFPGDAEFAKIAAELNERSEVLFAKFRDQVMKDSAVQE